MRMVCRKRLCASATTMSVRRFGYNGLSAALLVLFLAVAPPGTLSQSWLQAPSNTNNQRIPTVGALIDDAQCTIEDLEHANDAQLAAILQDLVKTAFFRTVFVDQMLDHKCPLQSFRRNQSPPEEAETPQEEDTAECDGGNVAQELDIDAPPLCHLSTDEHVDLNPFMDASRTTEPLTSNALNQLSQEGFTSKAQRNTFSWKRHSDEVVRENADSDSQDDCEADQGSLPDSFWMDMCLHLQNDDKSQIVNLLQNPERNTGYNGTHIWKAIYEENCIAVDGKDDGMCYEERVLYRLFSGLHTSTSISIAKHYYPPSKKKGRTDWEPNPQYFMEKFENHPDHIRNLYFSYVVVLRALRKAAPFLHRYEIRTGHILEDETASILLKRLLDSAILESCNSVFSAFDESLMFQGQDEILKHNFKEVFHNVSSIMDCVQCQQCKLHGKLAMLGYGAALKVLFMADPVLERDEIIALINTLHKFSDSIRDIRQLTAMYWEQHNAASHSASSSKVGGEDAPSPLTSSPLSQGIQSVESMDQAVEIVATLGRTGQLSMEREAELVRLALERQAELLVLAKHYRSDLDKFLQFSATIGTVANDISPDAIIVGSGLAGLAAALNILDRGGTVLVIEKERLLGGNSNKASSGINACCPNENGTDSLELFRNDTIRSAGSSVHPDLVDVLVSSSAEAVTWLRDRIGVDLSLIAQLGGHSSKRTHRPSNGMVGAEIIYGIQKAVRAFESTGRVKILLDTKVVDLLTDGAGCVKGVKTVSSKDESNEREFRSDHVILATGGFAADRSTGSFLEKYRPELLKMPTTAGNFSTGDGITLASSLGAGTVDMDKVQVHPTGWVDPADPNNTSKILAAELMRGVGGILLNDKGERFCDELGTRAYVTKKMLSHNPNFETTGKWDADADIPTFHLILSSAAAEAGRKHVDLYTHKGLMTRVEGINALAEFTGLPRSALESTLTDYLRYASQGNDPFGKKTFMGLPKNTVESETFYVGKVTPVLHYCMGGITIDVDGNVQRNDGEPICGLHAAGEVTGGVHGVNRLAGNSLLECTVFGSRVGKRIPIKARNFSVPRVAQTDTKKEEKELRIVSMDELGKHNTPDDCWVAIHEIVYDLTEFADEHPAGPQSIHELAGMNGTLAFATVHQARIMEDFVEERVGKLKALPS